MRKICLIMAGLLLFTATESFAQEKKKTKSKVKKGATEEKVEKKEEDKFNDITKKCVKYDGLFTLWRDTTSGKTYLEVREDQLGKEYIYFNHIVDGVVEAGYFRGAYGGSKIISLNKFYERIDIFQENTRYYFDPNNELSKAADANINKPLLASEKIEATSKDKKKYLIDGDAIFLSEKFQIIKYPTPPGSPSVLGNLSSSKTRLERINNYPENTELTVAYVYENSSPTVGGAALTDPRNITIKYQHSILAVPENDYVPRRDDPRIGYFMTQVDDMTSTDAVYYRDVIHRWHLVKKDPNAAISEPVEPITFWIENTTPKEFRAIIKDACERWNSSFEKAGFKNAVVCKIQPDDADWDAGDIRYNVLRWTSSPNPPFGGYGPSFVNPRTGQILGADIMLEFVALSNRVKAEKAFKSTGFLQDEELEGMEKQFNRNPFLCLAADHINHNLQFSMAFAAAMNMDEMSKKEMVEQMLYRLVLHEVGHTLGLNHNMRASTMSTMEDVKNPEKALKDGLANSIMEYPAFNYQLNPAHQTIYCDTKPGPYDDWAIEYGYSPAAADPITEELRLRKIAERSNEPNLMFGNDADDMRSSGRGIDPDVNIYDLTNDPVAYAVDRCELVNAILPKLKTKYTLPHESYQELVQAYLITTGEYANQIRIMTRQIGGVHYNRAVPAQDASILPLKPVSEEKQKAAMKALEKYAFAPNAWEPANQLYNYLLEQRRGFNHFGKNPDPNIHARVLNMQKECLNHLLHPNVLARITDSKLYGNTYTLDKMMTDLTNAIFLADAKSNINTFRQNLQVEYVQRLIKFNGEKSPYDNVSKAMAWSELKRIDTMMAGGGGDALTKAHRDHIRLLIKKALEA